MARPIDEFAVAWEALAGDGEGEGWRCIPVDPAGPCQLLAARRFPGNREALLAGFKRVKVPSADSLPEGGGFEVAKEDPRGDGKTWIALTRKDSGGAELFAEMVRDVAGAMDAARGRGEEGVLRAMLSRVRAWQEFMRRSPRGLSPEAELGLAGELFVLSCFLKAGVEPASAVGAWVGPLDGIQDFELGRGAVEVKATLSMSGFPAKIGSLEQLDNSIRAPLFLVGVRFRLSESGRTLGDLAADVGRLLSGECGAAADYEDRLISAGFPPAHADRYTRRLVVDAVRGLEVGEGFPRFVPGSVPDAIRKINYQLDLDRVAGRSVSLDEVVQRLGVA